MNKRYRKKLLLMALICTCFSCWNDSDKGQKIIFIRSTQTYNHTVTNDSLFFENLDSLFEAKYHKEQLYDYWNYPNSQEIVSTVVLVYDSISEMSQQEYHDQGTIDYFQ